ncbi:hypothetical protein [Legionella sp. km772]|uniref:hypothetical protein n=1 Tax=Legionella sp. km772 TaxID=2498111 RepID=UPI000F8C4FEC|nr:hypothetical protein [Legionella sp. km772]RUR12625.1 hypothetical protein ELY15_04520 [Legionella sp. km772]
MKNYLFAGIAALFAVSASAEPTHHDVTFTCPAVNAISHFGDYVAGYGVEAIFGDSRAVYFKTIMWPANVPSNLSTYNSLATNYDSINSLITCSYVSSDANNADFDLHYQMTNGKGGLITAQTPNMISIQFPIGLTK